MSGSKRRFFSGNSIEQALVAAASHFRVEPQRIAYRPVDKRHGFVRIQRRVVIEVDPEHPVREPGEVAPPTPGVPAPLRSPPPPRPAAAPLPERPRPPAPAAAEAPRREPRPRTWDPASRRAAEGGEGGAGEAPLAEAREELLPAARQALGLILRLAGLDLTAEMRVAEGRLEVDLAGPDRARVLDEEGEVLSAIEYLLPRVLRGAAGESMPCQVDSGGFRGRREEELRELARRTAERVRASGQPQLLEPLSPAERRIVHLELADDPEVETASEGDGYFKRITIRRIG